MRNNQGSVARWRIDVAPLSGGLKDFASGEENAGYDLRPLLWSHHGEGYDPRLASLVFVVE